ncbi:hypothetical protein U1Q18_048322, partial [Sarracenia purpurea var. burkii]
RNRERGSRTEKQWGFWLEKMTNVGVARGSMFCVDGAKVSGDGGGSPPTGVRRTRRWVVRMTYCSIMDAVPSLVASMVPLNLSFLLSSLTQFSPFYLERVL